jgi:hypothetical protein
MVHALAQENRLSPIASGEQPDFRTGAVTRIVAGELFPVA